MASIVKGTIGDQQVELNNAATESTLAALLAVAKSDSAVLKMMAQKAGVDAKAIEKASKAIEAQSSQGQAASKGLGDVAPKASLLGGFLMDMGQSVMATMGNLVSFGDELLEGKARASDLFKAFKDLPLGLGMVASIFQKVLEYQQKNLDSWQKLSSTGAGLNGSLTDLRTKAFAMGLTLTEMETMYRQNSDVLSRLGGSATAGGKALSTINASLMKSKMGDHLLGLGYSFADLNNLVGGYLRVSGDGIRVGKDTNAEMKRLTDNAAHYGKELDFMARLTGESREELEKKMQAEAQEASWQAHLATLDEEGKKKANDALMRANALGGKGAMDALKASIMGFAAPFSEEGRMFVSTMRGGTQAIESMAKIVTDGTKAEDASARLNKLFSQGMAANIRDLKSLSNVISATGQGGTEAGKALLEIQSKANVYISQKMTEADAIEKATKEVLHKAEQDAKAAAAAVANEKRMKELSLTVQLALAPILDLLAKNASKLVDAFMSFIHRVDMPKLGQELANFMEAVMNYVKNMFTPEGRDKILNDLKYIFKLVLIELKKALIPWYTESDAEEEKRRLDSDKKIMDARAEKASELIEKDRITRQLEILRDEKAKEHLEKSIKNDKATIEALGKKKELNDDEKKTLEEAKGRLKENEVYFKMVDKLKDEDRKKMIEGLQNRLTKLDQTTKVAAEETSGEKRSREKLETQASIDESMAVMSTQMFDSGTVGKTGNILNDFGKESNAKLHGREAVLNETQLTNLAKGAMDTGSAQAQERLSNAVLALNKQQVLTNQILGQIADYTRRTAENPYGKWGNAFARI